jgi:hypothetical protein
LSYKKVKAATRKYSQNENNVSFHKELRYNQFNSSSRHSRQKSKKFQTFLTIKTKQSLLIIKKLNNKIRHYTRHSLRGSVHFDRFALFPFFSFDGKLCATSKFSDKNIFGGKLPLLSLLRLILFFSDRSFLLHKSSFKNTQKTRVCHQRCLNYSLHLLNFTWWMGRLTNLARLSMI